MIVKDTLDGVSVIHPVNVLEKGTKRETNNIMARLLVANLNGEPFKATGGS